MFPVMVTALCGKPIFGIMPVITGAREAMMNGSSVVAEPVAVVTKIGPLVAPAGTDVWMWFEVADITGAGIPLKVTVFWLAEGLKPVPCR